MAAAGAGGGGGGGSGGSAMLLTVFCLRRDRSELTFSLQVDADFELQNFRALCELESGIPAAESQVRPCPPTGPPLTPRTGEGPGRSPPLTPGVGVSWAGNGCRRVCVPVSPLQPPGPPPRRDHGGRGLFGGGVGPPRAELSGFVEKLVVFSLKILLFLSGEDSGSPMT